MFINRNSGIAMIKEIQGVIVLPEKIFSEQAQQNKQYREKNKKKVSIFYHAGFFTENLLTHIIHRKKM